MGIQYKTLNHPQPLKVILENKGTLIIFSGLPASGKTSLATRLATHLKATYVRVDTIEVGLRVDGDTSDIGIKCYHVAQLIAQENLRLGNSVIGDSVNPVRASREGWNATAESIGAQYINVQVVCTDKEEHRNRLAARGTTVPGLTEPSWEQVQEREYHPWEQDRVLIETSGKSIDACFEELLSSLRKIMKVLT